VSRGETVGLLEVYRSIELPWTSGEIDTTRMLAQSAVIAIEMGSADAAASELPWTPGALGSRTADSTR
jgi:GAF domain-containing protein